MTSKIDPATSSQNLALVSDLYAWAVHPDPAIREQAAALLADNYRCWHPGRGWIDKTEKTSIWATAAGRPGPRFSAEIRLMVANDRHVAVESAERGGGAGEGKVVLVFFDIKAGKIVEQRAYYNDSDPSEVWP